jgi:hypothetical protein
MRASDFLASVAGALILLSLAPGVAAGAGKPKGDVPEESYLRVPALAAGVMLTGGRRGVILVEPGVDATDPVVRARVDASVPRLRAAWFAVLQRYAAGLRPGTAPDADQLARAMQAETDRVLGRKGATFLIGSVLVH